MRVGESGLHLAWGRDASNFMSFSKHSYRGLSVCPSVQWDRAVWVAGPTVPYSVHGARRMVKSLCGLGRALYIRTSSGQTVVDVEIDGVNGLYFFVSQWDMCVLTAWWGGRLNDRYLIILLLAVAEMSLLVPALPCQLHQFYFDVIQFLRPYLLTNPSLRFTNPCFFRSFRFYVSWWDRYHSDQSIICPLIHFCCMAIS